MTALDSILCALARAAGGYDCEVGFTEADLVVLAWQFDRDRFGLHGRAALYPDSTRVSSEISKAPHGLLARGYLLRVAPRTYRLTAEGLSHGRRMLLEWERLRRAAG